MQGQYFEMFCTNSFSPLASWGKHSTIPLQTETEVPRLFLMCMCDMCAHKYVCRCACTICACFCVQTWDYTERLSRFLAAFFIEVGFLPWAELIALQYSFSGKASLLWAPWPPPFRYWNYGWSSTPIWHSHKFWRSGLLSSHLCKLFNTEPSPQFQGTKILSDYGWQHPTYCSMHCPSSPLLAVTHQTWCKHDLISSSYGPLGVSNFNTDL